jgi:fatty acid desaturase
MNKIGRIADALLSAVLVVSVAGIVISLAVFFWVWAFTSWVTILVVVAALAWLAWEFYDAPEMPDEEDKDFLRDNHPFGTPTG